jgi:hypothetical protein
MWCVCVCVRAPLLPPLTSFHPLTTLTFLPHSLAPSYPRTPPSLRPPPHPFPSPPPPPQVPTEAFLGFCDLIPDIYGALFSNGTVVSNLKGDINAHIKGMLLHIFQSMFSLCSVYVQSMFSVKFSRSH